MESIPDFEGILQLFANHQILRQVFDIQNSKQEKQT